MVDLTLYNCISDLCSLHGITPGKLCAELGMSRSILADLKSGRKNQIRVHFSESGHPVVGDVKYGAQKAPRLFLHAKTLAFTHPANGRKMEFSSNSPF